MIVEMTPKYAEYKRHRGERFETDGKTYKVGGEEVCYLKGYGAYAKDGLRELGGGQMNAQEIINDLWDAVSNDDMYSRTYLVDEVEEICAENVKLRQMVTELYDMAWHECPSAFEAAFADRMRELGVQP